MAFKFDIWQEGKYLDIWSIVHILTGVLIGGFIIILGVNFWIGLGLTTFLLILYEVGEVVGGVKETFANIVVDVIIGIFGYLFAWFFYGKFKTVKERKNFKKIIWILFSVVILLSIWGWTAAAFR